MKVVLAALILVAGSNFAAVSFAADETVTVTGSRIPGGGGSGGVHFPSRPGGGTRPFPKVDPCSKGPSDCGEPNFPAAPAAVGGWNVGDIVEGLGTVVKILAKSPSASGKVSIKIKKPDGTEIDIEVDIKVTIPK